MKRVILSLVAILVLFACGGKKAVKEEKPEIQKTPSGLKFVELKAGKGERPSPGQTIVIHYVGKLENGEVFDSSRDRGKPLEFIYGSGKVIEGLEEGVATMKPGGKRKLIIPPDLGYGSRSVGPIPANSTLIFEVELIDVR